MPFVIVDGVVAADRGVPAVLCQANLLGQPDRRSRVPILIRRVSEQVLLILPDDPREIISAIHENGSTKFAVGPTRNRMALAASVQLARLTKLAELLDQTGRILRALESGESVLEHHAALSDWARKQQDCIPE